MQYQHRDCFEMRDDDRKEHMWYKLMALALIEKVASLSILLVLLPQLSILDFAAKYIHPTKHRLTR